MYRLEEVGDRELDPVGGWPDILEEENKTYVEDG